MSRQTLRRALHAATALAMTAAVYAIVFHAPVEKTMGIVQKIFYLHLPAAVLSFTGFAITCLSSVMYLARRDFKWDRLAGCAAEVGVLFCTIVLITGPIWAKSIWNVWWTWDPRLTTTLILWLIYLAYLLLRASSQGARRAGFAAVFGIAGFVNVPLTFLAVRLWRTIHPVLITSRGLNMSPPIWQTLAISTAAFALLFATLLVERTALEKLLAGAEAAQDAIEHRLAAERQPN